MPDFEDMWLLVPAAKKAVIKDGIVRAGGSCAADMLHDMLHDKPELDEHKVPMNWHSLPCELYEELFASYQLDGMVLLTCLDEPAAIAAIRQQLPIPYTLNLKSLKPPNPLRPYLMGSLVLFV